MKEEQNPNVISNPGTPATPAQEVPTTPVSEVPIVPAAGTPETSTVSAVPVQETPVTPAQEVPTVNSAEEVMIDDTPTIDVQPEAEIKIDKKSKWFIGVLIAMVVIFIIALPYVRTFIVNR